MKKSKDIFKYISAYSKGYRQKALDQENLTLFVFLLEKKEIMTDYTSQDVKEFIENDLRKIVQKEHNQRIQQGINYRETIDG